jgi:L-lactate utilization protein LutB
MHVILRDNGPTRPLADEIGRQVLRCIRCSGLSHRLPGVRADQRARARFVYPGPSCSTTGPAEEPGVFSSLPDIHVCVVRRDQIVPGVPDAVAGLARCAGGRGSAVRARPATSSSTGLKVCADREVCE